MLVLGVIFAAGIGGCDAQLAALANDSTLVANRAAAEQVLTALSQRFIDVSRDPKYDAARLDIARAAFLPSRAFDDTSAWTASTGIRRTLMVSGRFTGRRYRQDAVHALAPITQLADSRHAINLTRLSSNEFSWDTDVQFAIGTLGAEGAGAFFTALLSSAEGRTDSALRATYRAALPLGTATLGQLFTLDSARSIRLPDRSSLTTFAFTMTPEGIQDRLPRYADYLRKYARTTKAHWILSDRQDAAFVEYATADGHTRLRVRTLDGALIPLAGPARPMPDSLRLRGEMTVKVRVFTMGFRDYNAEFIIVRSPHERAWNIVTRQEPHWVLPFVTERLLRSPLRRPFRGSGTLFRIGVRDDSSGAQGAQSVVYRRMHLEVQESAILRFIGRLGFLAVSDYAGDTEREANKWMSEVFTAFLADVQNAAAFAQPVRVGNP